MACRAMLNKIDKIMDKIDEVCIDRQRERVADNLPLKPISEEEVRSRLATYRETFQVLDAVFAGLRSIEPTKDEIDMTGRSIALLEHYWELLDLPRTPKYHLLSHAVMQMIRFGGLGDKTDEFMEKWHQIMGIQHDLTCKMQGGYKARATTMIRNLWRNSHPRVVATRKAILDVNAREPYKGGAVDKTSNERRAARWETIRSLEEKLLVEHWKEEAEDLAAEEEA